MAICELFGSREAIERYLEKAEAQLEKQYIEATASGLADDVGIEGGFNVEWFYRQADSLTLDQLAEACKKEPLELSYFLRELIENHNKRNFERVISQYRMTEEKLLVTARRELSRRNLYRAGYVLRYVSKEQSEKWNGKKTECIVLTRETPEQKPAQEEQKKQA
jgi:hypothetical protein